MREVFEQPKNYTTTYGYKIWYLPSKGKDYHHRLDGPAIKHKDGTKHWFVNGERHRLNGPAIEYEDGSKIWWVDDKLHRLDGPAIEHKDGTKEWWINGKELPTDEVEIWLEENDVDLKTESGQMAFKLRWL